MYSKTMDKQPIKIHRLFSLSRNIHSLMFLNLYRKGSRNGVVVRALASHLCYPGALSALCHTWDECIVSFRLLRGFSPAGVLRVAKFKID